MRRTAVRHMYIEIIYEREERMVLRPPINPMQQFTIDYWRALGQAFLRNGEVPLSLICGCSVFNSQQRQDPVHNWHAAATPTESRNLSAIQGAHKHVRRGIEEIFKR